MHEKRQVKALHQDIDLAHYGIFVCNDCHKHIHKFIGHEDLAYHYYSKDRLSRQEKLRRFVRWVSKQDKRVKRG